MRNSKLGFSLVELMVVIGIMGILASIAVPKFQSYQAKAKMVEATNLLNQIHTLQVVYFTENSTYAGTTTATTYAKSANANTACTQPAWATAIGFQINPCNNNYPLFQYSVVTANNGANFTATATDVDNVLQTSGNTRCAITINQDKTINKTNCP